MSNEELIIEYKNGNEKALEMLIEFNQRMIHKIAKKYKGIAHKNNLEYQDLLQVGNIGFLKAIRTYNHLHENQAKFSTYAVSVVNREIYSAINGRTSKEIKNIELNFNCRSLNEPLKNSDGDGTIEDTIKVEFDDYLNIEDDIYLKQLRDELEVIIKEELSLNKREVIFLKYGWFNTEPMTYEEIAEIMNIPKKRIIELENKALSRLKKSEWKNTRGKEYYKELRGAIINEYEIKNISYLDKWMKRLL